MSNNDRIRAARYFADGNLFGLIACAIRRIIRR